MTNQILKKLAVKAKNRLINRDGLNKEKKTIYSPNIKFKVISNEDVGFNDKANSLEENSLYPLGVLMDNDYFLKLSPQNKERYLLETIDKYQKFKKKVDSEREKFRVLS